jgi:hypothetical protein
VIVGSREVEFRTILGAISVFTLLGLLFAFLYVAFSRWTHDPFFAGGVAARSSDYLFFSYTTLTTTGYGNLVPAGTSGSPSRSSRCSSARSSSSRSSPDS